jgi:hypothetical protein
MYVLGKKPFSLSLVLSAVVAAGACTDEPDAASGAGGTGGGQSGDAGKAPTAGGTSGSGGGAGRGGGGSVGKSDGGRAGGTAGNGASGDGGAAGEGCRQLYVSPVSESEWCIVPGAQNQVAIGCFPDAGCSEDVECARHAIDGRIVAGSSTCLRALGWELCTPEESALLDDCGQGGAGNAGVGGEGGS